mgnify:CR=1 FL=1|nr:MAG TPA: tail completion protein [Caudoviricetes sp.]
MAANTLKKLLRESNINGIEPEFIFAHRVPSPYREHVQDKIVILLTDVMTEFEEFGSNQPHSRVNTVQIQFFYPLDYANEPEDIENTVLMYAFKNGWCPGVSLGSVLDPETHSLYSTYQLNQTKAL